MKTDIPVIGLNEPYLTPGGHITQNWANSSTSYASGRHNGTDIGFVWGQPDPFVTSMYPGEVTFAHFDPNGDQGYGQYVRVWTPIEDYIKLRPDTEAEYKQLGVGFVEFLYAHFGWLNYEPGGELDGILVKVGQRVERGTPLGTMGSTGKSTGRHTHIGKKLYTANRMLIDPGYGWTKHVDPTDDIFLIEPQMSNALILKDENSLLLVLALPITNEEALKSYGMNFGIDVPLKADGHVDFDKLNKNGTFKKN